MTYHQIKLGHACERYVQQTNNSHLRKIIAQFRTGSHWLHIETGRHKKLAKQDRTCPMCFYKLTNPGITPECWDAFDSDDESSGHIEDDYHAILDCSGYTYARELFQDLSPESHHIYQPVSQPATMQQAGQVPYLDQNDAHEQSLGQSDGSLPGPEQTLNQSII